MSANTSVSLALREAQAMKERRTADLIAAVRDHRDLKDRERQLEIEQKDVKKRLYDARARVYDLMKGDESKVVGDTLITLTHNGVDLKKIDVLPMPGSQPCLL